MKKLLKLYFLKKQQTNIKKKNVFLKNKLSYFKTASLIYENKFPNLYQNSLFFEDKISLIISFLPNNVYLTVFNNTTQKIELKLNAGFLKIKCTIRQRVAIFWELINLFFRDYFWYKITTIKIKHNSWNNYQAKLYFLLTKQNTNLTWEWTNLIPHNGCRVKNQNKKSTYTKLQWFH